MKKIIFDAKFILKILLILLLINFICLLFVDGRLWVLLCFMVWSEILFILITIYFIYLEKKIKEKPKVLFKKIKPKWQKFFRYSFLTVFISLLLFFILLFANLSFPFVFNPVMHWKAEQNKGELKELVNNLTKNSVTDKEKTISILNWFERYSGNIYNIWGHSTFGNFIFGDGSFNGCIFCMRIVEREPPLWVLTSRCGACEEHSILFREMAYASGLKVRSVICYEIDHVWDEVFIDNNWVIVDPANVVFSENMTGFNLSASSFEMSHAGRTHNISYVFAEYSDKRQEDITYRYAGNLSHINITTVDENLNPIPNVDISVFSNNKFIKQMTGLSFKTGNSGKYQLSIGGGDLTFDSKKNIFIPLYNETTNYFTDGENYNLTIVLKGDWTLNSMLTILPLIILTFISLIIGAFLYFKRRVMLKKYLFSLLILLVILIIVFISKDLLVKMIENEFFLYVAIPLIITILAPIIYDWWEYRFSTPKFSVHFKPTEGKTFKEEPLQEINLLRGQEELIWIMLHNNGKVITDNWFCIISFKEGFKLIPIDKTIFKDIDFVKKYTIQKKYNVAHFNSIDFSPLIPYNETVIFPIVIKTPEKEDKYPVNITMFTGNHRNKFTHKLFINVIDKKCKKT